jgi:hypothetical protein
MPIILKRPLSIFPAKSVCCLMRPDQHDAVGFRGVLVEEGFDAFGRVAERDHFERAAHRAAHGFFDDAVVREHVRLAFGRGRAVASHGREDERVHAAVFPEPDHRLHDGGDVGDAAAADSDGDARAGEGFRRNRRR